jgi:APA family basic amino acid/polyamine antiporter
MLQAVWSSFLVAVVPFRELFRRVIYTEWIFFGFMAIALFIFRRRSDLERGYKVWGYPFVPAIFILSSFAIVISQIVSNPINSISGLLFVAAGFPIYYLWVK